MTVVISLLHRLIILEHTSSRGANWGFKYTQVFPSNKFSPLHRNRPKAVKNIRKIRAISYVFSYKPHINQRLWKGTRRRKAKRAGRCESVENKAHHTLCVNTLSTYLRDTYRSKITPPLPERNTTEIRQFSRRCPT